jgi:3-deoxy-7-phosphoheptulonate synthase
MAESFMIEGNQKVVKDEPLVYGQSITDACLHWADSEKLLRDLAQASKERKALLVQ